MPKAKPIEGAQRCRGGCNRVLPLEKFNLDHYAANGRQSYCPECKAKATKEARRLKAERERMYLQIPGLP